MIYLREFTFPSGEQEFDYILSIQRKCYNTFYPFKILSKRELSRLNFAPITILYGGNGSGKTTALNVIAEKLGLQREANYNKSNFFDDYVDLCVAAISEEITPQSRIMTSDDVFDRMLNVRAINDGIDNKREELFDEYMDAKYSKFQFRGMEDYERLRKVNQSRSGTQSRYVRNHLGENIREYSNGESGFKYFLEKMEEDALYLLDEPENSLSPERQLELVQFIEESVRFFGCQFIISTHSPFLLALEGAKVYDLDEDPVEVKPWTRLKNVRMYYEFFQKHKDAF